MRFFYNRINEKILKTERFTIFKAMNGLSHNYQ